MCAAGAPANWRIGVDVGGTFADCVGRGPGGQLRHIKILSDGRKRIALEFGDGDGERRKFDGASGFSAVAKGLPAWCAPALVGAEATTNGGQHVKVIAAKAVQGRGGVGTGLAGAGLASTGLAGVGVLLQFSQPLAMCRWVDLASGEEAPVWGCRLLTGCPPATPLPALTLHVSTTRGTNALLEAGASNVGVVVNEGFEGALEIGTQQRLGIFDLAPRKPPSLAGCTVGVRGRLAADGSELEPLDAASVEDCVEKLRAAGVRHVAVALMHSWKNSAHEAAVAMRFRVAGFESVVTSSELAAVPRFTPRAQAAVVEARLHAPVKAYLGRVAAQCSGSFSNSTLRAGTSAGGVVPAESYRAKDSLLSGPAAGCRGAVAAIREAGLERAVTFDMGGTSTDVARVDQHGVGLRFESTVSGIVVATPSVDVHSIAAGGGSICTATAAGLFVGPRSAGANPGPACYGKGGPLTLTDVNVLLGRLWAEGSSLPLDVAAARAAAEAQASASGRVMEQMLRGFLEVAHEHTAAAVRAVSTAAGHDPRTHALVAFGGAGGQHACAVAARVGMPRVLVLPRAGFVSGTGVLTARVEHIAETAVLAPLGDGHVAHRALQETRKQAEGGSQAGRVSRAVIVLRARGRTGQVLVDAPAEASPRELAAHARMEFSQRLRALGDPAAAEEPDVDSVRVVMEELGTSDDAARSADSAEPSSAQTARWTVPHSGEMSEDDVVSGPALILDEGATVVVEQGWQATMAPGGGLWLDRSNQASPASSDSSVDLEVAAARFVSIATWIGTCLERAAHSVNVKERLDFSCGVLDPEGRLVANAPHIPVHLGALGACVRSMLKVIAIGPGQIALTNDPRHGGSHLPDLTVVRAVHAADGVLLGYVAARAHHAEVGGNVPGSMPPDARTLEEEGVVIPPCIIGKDGEIDEGVVHRAMCAGPFPSRAPETNLADIRAAAAALDAGAKAMVELAAERGTQVTLDAMQRLLERSAEHVRTLARSLAPSSPFAARGKLDDGTELAVHVEARADGTMKFRVDAPALHPRCFNAPLSVSRSVILYVLRVLAARAAVNAAGPPLDDHVAPLNEGFLEPVEIQVSHGFLNAFSEPAQQSAQASALPPVFAGNTESSQRLVDTVLLALGAAASSQGTMNNLVFGNEGFSVYETIGGGAGACEGADGVSSIHVHMSNTRLTDPETLELRHPVRLEALQVRAGSGGVGKWSGGNGTVRRIRMLQPTKINFIGQHRVEVPEGLAGGQAGAVGEQFIVRADGTRVAMPGSFSAQLTAGDAVEIQTPGGGGYEK